MSPRVWAKMKGDARIRHTAAIQKHRFRFPMSSSFPLSKSETQRKGLTSAPPAPDECNFFECKLREKAPCCRAAPGNQSFEFRSIDLKLTGRSDLLSCSAAGTLFHEGCPARGFQSVQGRLLPLKDVLAVPLSGDELEVHLVVGRLLREHLPAVMPDFAPARLRVRHLVGGARHAVERDVCR